MISKSAGFFSLAIVLAGCRTYEPLPLSPERSASDLDARSLSDAGLHTFIAKQLGADAQTWDLPALTLVAFYYHPDLDVARARIEVAEAAIITAGARPNPSAGIGSEYTLNAASPWTLAFSLDIPFETAGKRGYRIERARHLSEAARIELAATAWNVRSRLRAALVEHLLTLAESNVRRVEREVRSEAVAVMKGRHAAGEVSRVDVYTGETELAGIDLDIETLKGRSAETLSKLAAALGVPIAALTGVEPAWPSFETPPKEQDLPIALVQRAGLFNRLDIRRMLAEYAALENALQLEVAKQYPDIHVGPGYAWDQGENKFSLGLSISLPVFNQNEGPIAEAAARRKEGAARFLSLQARAIAEFESALARFRSARSALAEAEKLLAALDRQEVATKRTVELGQEDKLALVGLRVQRAGAARARLAALGRTQDALGALEDALQRPIGPDLPSVSLENPREEKRP